MKKIVFDGNFLTEEAAGVQRYAMEVLRWIDQMPSKLDMELAVPEGWDDSRLLFRQIRIVHTGHRKGDSWEQIDLVRYLKKEKAYAVYFENVFPVLYRKGFLMIHDISLKVNPHFYNRTIRGRISILWRRFNYWIACRSQMDIGTVSQFSKKEISRVYHVPESRIAVLPNSWQHMREIQADESIFSGFKSIEKRKYCFALSTLARNKNFRWIVEAARKNPDEVFVIAGGGNLKQFVRENLAEGLKNLILPGYISDGQAKALMAHCKAFLFPTLYEGFGIPPMEAIAAGAESIVISDIEVMHEVYGDAGTYINPLDYSGKMPDLKILTEDERAKLLSRFSWEETARKLLTILEAAAGEKDS